MSPGESVVWKVHREVVLLAGWGRAILLQLAHPLVARGVAEHSGFRSESWGRVRRLERTLGAMLTLTFGTPEEIARVAARINHIHDGIHGRLGAPHGPFAADTRYSAHDPALLAWVHGTLLDSFLLTYERFVAPLTAEERDRYCAESAGVEDLLGMPTGSVPRSVAELRVYMDDMLAGGSVVVTGTARELARDVVWPPAPWPVKPLLAVTRLATVGLLPPAIRAGYGYEWDARRERTLRCLTALVRGGLPLVPPPLRHWPAARRALARERGLRRLAAAPTLGSACGAPSPNQISRPARSGGRRGVWPST
ncbi:MAG TPA: oxygenase MpaB family protein [Methylomirabilota bacterium]|nr:oxygenase MpaB family protein [Methylomirabilota bacterium]